MLSLREMELGDIRFTLDAICGNTYEIFDRIEKKTFFIRGDKRWEKWRSEHKNEWKTNF